MIGRNRRTRIHFWREMAELRPCAQLARDRAGRAWQRDGAGGSQPRAYCQNRYPSPRRPDRFAVGPAPLFSVGQFRAKPLQLKFSVVFKRENADSHYHKTNQDKGSIQCSNSVSFSPVWQWPACRPASTTISSAALPAPLPVPSSPMRLAATPSRVPSSVARPVRCATKSRPLAADLIAPRPGRPNLSNRRSGISPGRRFFFEGP